MDLISDAGRLTIPADGVSAHWVEQLRVADLSVGTYSIPAGGIDAQDPHTEDEIYVITAGQATLVAGAASLPVGPGSVVYVPAGEVHRFVDVVEDFAALVLFAPAEESRSSGNSHDHGAEHAREHRHEPDHAGADLTDVVMDEAFWDERYGSASALWSGQPNPQLVAEVTDLAPGRALDVGSGEGADAIWLAERGWHVTALDISGVALARGAAHAVEAGPEVARRITWQHADLTRWVPDAARYELVSAQFMHPPSDLRNALFRQLADSVAPGGFLLIVGHHPADLQFTTMRPQLPELFYTGADIAALLDPADWEIVVSAARERSVTDPDGHPVIVQDAVLRAQRR
jgi:SAM-dependent methyltransferase/quercetin dioxygenase-like cupin family protein